MSHVSQQSPLRVLELFAGVGGFRCALEPTKTPTESTEDPAPGYQVVWANQYEPDAKRQWAADIYRWHWPGELDGRDIRAVLSDPHTLARLAELRPDVLVGGFPCQDYSVAQPVRRAHGLAGDKGQLWWSVHDLLKQLRERGQPVAHLILENVDRLLSSPAGARGRDFAVILGSLLELGYAVEWRVVNAADYGYPTRRKRLYILAHHQHTALGRAALAAAANAHSARQWLTQGGAIARGLPGDTNTETGLLLPHELPQLLADTELSPAKSPFANAGLCACGQVWTAPIAARSSADFTAFVGQAQPLTLGDVVAGTTVVPEAFFIPEDQLPRWQACKGAKRIPRVSATGHVYTYSEGAMAFPDPLDRPARTVITSEGGASPSRTTHVVRHADGRLRRLTPEEVEALMGFARGHTALDGIRPAQRVALMGNAIVVGVVRRLGWGLLQARVQAAPGMGASSPVREGYSLDGA